MGGELHWDHADRLRRRWPSLLLARRRRELGGLEPICRGVVGHEWPQCTAGNTVPGVSRQRLQRGGGVHHLHLEPARANDYSLQVATDPGFAEVVFGDWVGNFIGITLTGFPDNGQDVFWRVAARNAQGASPFSTAWSLTNGPSAPPATPSPASPANGSNVAGTSITFTWSQAARANDYFLQVAIDSSFAEVVFGDWIGNFSGVTLTGFPDNGRSFFWRVAAGNALGPSPYSAAWSVTNGPSAVPERGRRSGCPCLHRGRIWSVDRR